MELTASHLKDFFIAIPGINQTLEDGPIALNKRLKRCNIDSL